MNEISITSLERDCIACPTAWIATTADDDELYIRYRWGDLTVKNRADNEEIYRSTLGDGLDGHLTVYELQDALTRENFKFNIDYPQTFYGFIAQDCSFDIMGTWITKILCDECNWTEPGDELEQLEYETVLPPKCPECNGTLTIETETPEHLQNIDSNDDETIIDNLEENLKE